MTHHARKARKRRTLTHKERELVANAMELEAERTEFREHGNTLRGLAYQIRLSTVIMETPATLRGSDSKSDPRD